MRDLKKYLEICQKELSDIGIHFGRIVEIKANTRAKKRWGQCRLVPGGYSININSVLLDERNDELGLKQTVIHELLHSCAGCMNHKGAWKRLADKVNRAYGYNIARCVSAKEIGVPEDAVPQTAGRTSEYKYAVQCSCCGYVFRRSKISKVILNPGGYRCGKCGGRLVRIT